MMGLILLAGCATVPERNPLPGDLVEEARIPGIPEARDWADDKPRHTDAWFDKSKQQIREELPDIIGVAHNYLAISGGGPRGAYTAGLLNGWTEAGDRPEFTIVTGVSTGALIAPFAFLGSEYDPVMKQMYTTMTSDDIYRKRSILHVVTGDSAVDTTPLRNKIASYVDEEVVAAIAEQNARGRRLYVVTTNIDAGRPVAWDLGKIASSDSPEAVQLIQDILLASASIPGAFPPVMFEVEADGQQYDEMHVDGGATSVVHLYPLALDWERLLDRLDAKGKPNVYLVRNGLLDEEYSTVERDALSITARTVSILMGSVVYGDIYRIYLATQRDGLNFFMAHIPETFDQQPTEAFDAVYMTELFNLGYNQAREGYDWQTTPPGFDVSEP